MLRDGWPLRWWLLQGMARWWWWWALPRTSSFMSLLVRKVKLQTCSFKTNIERPELLSNSAGIRVVSVRREKRIATVSYMSRDYCIHTLRARQTGVYLSRYGPSPNSTKCSTGIFPKLQSVGRIIRTCICTLLIACAELELLVECRHQEFQAVCSMLMRGMLQRR